MGNFNPIHLPAALIHGHDGHGDGLMKVAGAATAGVQNQCAILAMIYPAGRILMTVPHNHHLPGRYILRQVFLFVGHVEADAGQFKIQEGRQMLRPFLVVVAPHHIHRDDLFQLIQNGLLTDVPTVEDGVAALQECDHFWAE